MIKINVITNNNNWFNYLKKPNDYVYRKIVKLNLKEKKFKKNKIFCTLLLSGNKEIKNLNRKFRKKNKATDILSFPNFNNKNLKKNIKNKDFYLGDIAISHEEFVKKNKFEFENGFLKIFIHGFLHLLNFDHKLNKDYKIMNSVEKEIFHKVRG